MSAVSRNPFTLFIAAAIIVLSLINIAGLVATFNTPLDQADNVEDPLLSPDEAGDDVRDELVEDVGGLTSPTGLATLVSTIFLIGLTIGLAFGRPWELGAMFFLGADASFKLLNLISQLTTGKSLGDTLPSILLIGLDIALILGVFGHWRSNRQTTFPHEIPSSSQASFTDSR